MDSELGDWDAADSPLDRIAVSTLTTSVNDLIVANVDTVVHSGERVPASMAVPVARRIKEDYLSPATVYALLASRLHFQQESRSNPGAAKVWSTRSDVCEEVAVRLIAEYDTTELAQCLAYEFYPLADGSPLEVIPTWLRVSALELAIKSKAKRLVGHPVFVNIITDLWDGRLVLDPYVHKVHRADHLCCAHDLWRLTNARKGVLVRYDFETTTIFKPSRLRVPKYREWLKAFNMAILVGLYVLTISPDPSLFVETAFQVWLFAFIIDEVQVLRAVGGHLYFLTLWSLCDFVSMILGIVYLVLRDCVSPLAEHPTRWTNVSFDVLAVAGVTLIPRIFSVLEALPGFSRTVISVRKMITELLWCWVAIAMFSVGFWAALAHFGKGIFARTKVFYDLVQIMFGFTPAVWQTWAEYPGPGAMILFLYLFMAQFVVTTIVTAALSAKVVETKDNSIEEYHFLNAVRTELRIKSERQVLYFYSQPFNILGFFPLPLMRSVLPTQWYLRSNRSLLKLTHWHVFLAIYAYERLTSVIVTRRAKAAEILHQRVKQHLQSRTMLRRSRPRLIRTDTNSRTPLRSPVRSPVRSPIRSTARPQLLEPPSESQELGGARDAKFELVEELLNAPQPGRSVSGSSRVHSLRPRRWSFESEHESASVLAPSEDLDLHEVVHELRASNAKLEEMLERVLQKMGS